MTSDRAEGLKNREPHTPPSNAAIGKFFGGIGFWAVTMIGTQLKDRRVKDRRIKSDLAADKESLSRPKAFISRTRIFSFRRLFPGSPTDSRSR